MSESRHVSPRPALAVAALACSALLVAGGVSPLSASAFSSSFTVVGGVPGALAVDSTTHRVFAADQSSNVISIFDGSLDEQPVTRVEVGLHPVAIAIDESQRQIFVADSDSGTVSRFDADDPDPAAAVAVTVDHPSALAVDPVNHIVYVTSSTTNRVYSFLASPDAVSPALRSVPVGQEPSGVAVDAAAQVVAVTNSRDNTVSVFAARTAADDTGTPDPVPTTVPVGASPSGVAIDSSSHTAVVANLRDNTASRFDVTASSPAVDTVGVGRAPLSVAIDSGTHYAFVGNSLGMTVSQFAVSAAVPPVMDVPLGKAPRGVAIDESLGKVYASNPLNETVSGRAPVTPEAPWIFADSLHAATVGVWYTHVFEARGTPAPTLSLRGSLPAGLSFDAATGQLSGTPTVEDSQSVTLVAHNLAGPDATSTFRLVVTLPAPTLAPAGPLRSAKVGTAYSYRLTPTGSAPSTCAVSSGTLPAGITLSASTCALSGKPSAAGSFDFGVTARNSGGTAAASYQIIVAPAGGGTGCTDGLGGAGGSGRSGDVGGSEIRPGC
ncbi:hypothetical protein B7R54_03030 [Subtercola boreus]|uniref:Dystroglycan-type cadherin-like domain-containing protein n=1 Tax=Subtercola boreus TaxID=120213 RepID=A0A3E0VG12_9MICO|nr:putative Ig domain-containing protein [Subtercola boreus]RFA08310.1 hypothetical protein B7R54_03030 [Subtercola boreus]TQL54790.1 DNA-binding beta-propeller fold protein YncE [Subtercola boreus]